MWVCVWMRICASVCVRTCVWVCLCAKRKTVDYRVQQAKHCLPWETQSKWERYRKGEGGQLGDSRGRWFRNREVKNVCPSEKEWELKEQTNEKEQGWRDGWREGEWRFRQRSEMTSQACRVQSNEIQWYSPLSHDTQTNITVGLLLE